MVIDTSALLAILLGEPEAKLFVDVLKGAGVETIAVRSQAHDDWVDITAAVQDCVSRAASADGVATVFVPHTTAGVTIQENADPPLRQDISRMLDKIFPWHGDYGHCEDNAAAHMKAVLVGPSVQVPFVQRKLMLGTWQAIYFCEFDGPRDRCVHVMTGSGQNR